jgi:polyphenol oxidase
VQWRSEAGVRWLEAELPGARAAFSTRIGGASAPPFDALNLGLLTGDDADAVYRNRLRLAAALGRDPEGVLIGHQVHGAGLQQRAHPPAPNPYASGEGPGPEEADAQASANPRLTPLVQVADCLPVALAGSGGVAMAHCGWRGLAAGVVERAAAAVSAEAAAIGPGIGPCCYEVGEEVLDAFAGLGGGIATGGKLDLPEVARRLLDRAGVGAVETAGLCTHCNPELFFSHRRDGARTGRQGGLAWVDDA